MLRSAAITALHAFLAATYTGPIAIHREESIDPIALPYAVLRIGSSDNIGAGQAEIWDFSILLGVFHDADATAPASAETAAAAVFAALADPAAITAALAPAILVSWWERLTIEASLTQTGWQHIAGYRLIAAPAA